MLCVRPDDIVKIDSAAAARGVSVRELMRRAGDAVADAIMERTSPCAVLILCGGGNNGGDGYAAALRLMEKGYTVYAFDLLSKGQRSEAGKFFYDAYLERVGTPSLSLADAIASSSVIVDAIFGTGRLGELPSAVTDAITLANKAAALRVAVDLPTGIDGESGKVGNTVFSADLAVTLGFYKRGMLSYPAREYCGDILLADLGFLPCDLAGITQNTITVTDGDLKPLLGIRPKNSHKGTFGTAYLFCGSDAYRGAAVLAVGGALRMGAGLVAICAEPSVQATVLAAYPEAIVKERTADATPARAVLFGCGLGFSPENDSLLRRLLATEGAPLVIDADGINALSAMPDKGDLLKHAKRQIVLTPHPLEFARLADTDVGLVQANRLALAEAYAKEYGVTLVLKGAGTVIASPDGRVAVNQSGSSALAKGGSGDVLAGAVTGLLAQGHSPFNAAAVAVYLHGKAGDCLSARYSEYGVLPHELPLQMAEELANI